MVFLGVFLPFLDLCVTPPLLPCTDPMPFRTLGAYMFLERGGFVFHCRGQGSRLLELSPPFRLGCGHLQ